MTSSQETPHKLGRPVLAGSGKQGSFDELLVDSPFVFAHDGSYRMMYVGYDGHGYQTALARSTDLIEWEFEALILGRGGSGRWDDVNVSGTWILRENDLRGPGTLKKWKGRYWLAYHAYPSQGYEAGPGRIGLAWTTDETLHTWHRLPEPILEPADGSPWERGGLYKECLVEDGGRFYLFYNAKSEHPEGGAWTEQIGLALSNDLADFTRVEQNPVLPVSSSSWDAVFASDPCVVRDDDQWCMFYFGFDGVRAQEGLATSPDLIESTKRPDPLIRTGGAGELDATHAHKPSTITKDGVLFHFYTAERPARDGDPTDYEGQFRSITVATSSPVHES